MSLDDLLDFDDMSLLSKDPRKEQTSGQTEYFYQSTRAQATASLGSDPETAIRESSPLEDLQPVDLEPLTWDEDETGNPKQNLADKPLHVMESETDWDVLGLGWGATEEAVNQSFRRLMLQLHPDKNVGDPDAAAKTRRVYEARQHALQHATPSNFEISHTPEDKPFDPFHTKISDRYMRRLKRGEERRAKEKARKLEAEAEVNRLRDEHKEMLRARVPAPEPVPIFDGRADPFSGNLTRSKQGPADQESKRPVEQKVRQHKPYLAARNESQKPHAIGSFGNDGADENLIEVIEELDLSGSTSTPRSDPVPAPTTHDDFMRKDVNEVARKGSGATIKTPRSIPRSTATLFEGDLLNFSDDENANVKDQDKVPDPFADLRSIFSKKTKQGTKDAESCSKTVRKDIPVETSRVENIKEAILLSDATPGSSHVGKSATSSSSLDDIFQELSTLVLPDHSNLPKGSLKHSSNPDTEAKPTVPESERFSGIDTAHAKLTEKIQTRLHKEEADRLELLKHKDPGLYHQIKGQKKDLPRDLARRPSPARPNLAPRSTTAAKPPSFDRPWNAYRDTKTRVMAFMAQQEEENEELDRIRNRTAIDIFQAHREQAARMREEAERRRWL